MVKDSPRRTTRFLGPLFFNIFLNDMLWFVEKTDICNFADDSTIHSWAKSVNNVIENLQSDVKIALKWFKDNQMMPKNGKVSIHDSKEKYNQYINYNRQ